MTRRRLAVTPCRRDQTKRQPTAVSRHQARSRNTMARPTPTRQRHPEQAGKRQHHPSDQRQPPKPPTSKPRQNHPSMSYQDRQPRRSAQGGPAAAAQALLLPSPGASPHLPGGHRPYCPLDNTGIVNSTVNPPRLPPEGCPRAEGTSWRTGYRPCLGAQSELRISSTLLPRSSIDMSGGSFVLSVVSSPDASRARDGLEADNTP